MTHEAILSTLRCGARIELMVYVNKTMTRPAPRGRYNENNQFEWKLWQSKRNVSFLYGSSTTNYKDRLP
jgi:hypothetical protein